jgi:hypothetical protein
MVLNAAAAAAAAVDENVCSYCCFCPCYCCCWLQILQEHHAQHFQLLGKTSGRDVDKIAELQKLGVQLQQEYGLPSIAGGGRVCASDATTSICLCILRMHSMCHPCLAQYVPAELFCSSACCTLQL